MAPHRRAVEGRDRATSEPGSHGFYNSGQLFLEEYYTLALVAEAGIGTAHVDGNTRLCTATAATALIEIVRDGRRARARTPTSTSPTRSSSSATTWRRPRPCSGRASSTGSTGPSPPRLVVVDPRRTQAAKRADVHLAPRPGTNLPLLNGLLRILIERGWIDSGFIRDHTVDFETLVARPSAGRPTSGARSPAFPRPRSRRRPRSSAPRRRLVSTCLQGVYQSLQATASAVQVNNLHLIRGLIGKPGSTVFQMNGQPTAQNTRECGVNGEFIAFRNWNNPEHVAETARVWNVEPVEAAHLDPADPRDADVPARRDRLHPASSGSSPPTRPCRCPELGRIRRILAKEDLFVVVSDAFLTETAALADVVLPAAHLGREDRLHDQRRPDGPPIATRRSTRRARPGPTSTSSSTTPGGWTSGTRTARRSSSGRTPRARSRPGGSAAAGRRATTPG